MKAIARNWKAVLAVLLALSAVAVYFLGYRPGRENYLAERERLNGQIAMLQTTISENEKYQSVQDQLDPATQAVEESRAALYENFPVKMLEEDQLLYLLYLEDSLGDGKFDLGYNRELQEIFGNTGFSFGNVIPVQILSDGSVLQGLNLTVYYQASYAEFKNMVHTLATDSRVTSVRYATFSYDEEKKLLSGQVNLVLYLLDSPGRTYEEPVIPTPSTGKTNIFD